ncbi:MAG: hypothetical protein WAM60_19500 [Candidatus Promineifilaceae bacterium]
MDEELDNLREKSARTSTIYDDLEMEGAGAKGGNVLSGLTPQQRFILAFLLFLNVIACACGAVYLFVLR